MTKMRMQLKNMVAQLENIDNLKIKKKPVFATDIARKALLVSIQKEDEGKSKKSKSAAKLVRKYED